MNIECPQCGSTEFTKLSLVYAQGFSNLEARSRGLGLVFGSGGPDIAFGRAKTKGQLQSKLSEAVSPPRKWSIWRVFFWGLVGFPCVEFAFESLGGTLSLSGLWSNFSTDVTWLVYGYLALMTLVLLLTLWHNYGIFPARRRVWDRSFMCRRCGHVVEVSDLGASDAGNVRRLEREAFP
jgi:hypothetical protein